jgi:hypothetical protein
VGRAEDIFERLKSEGEAAIDEMIAAHRSESLFLDCSAPQNSRHMKSEG